MQQRKEKLAHDGVQIHNDGVSDGKFSGVEDVPCSSCSENGRHCSRWVYASLLWPHFRFLKRYMQLSTSFSVFRFCSSTFYCAFYAFMFCALCFHVML